MFIVVHSIYMLLALKFTVPKLYKFNNTKVNPPQAYVTVLVYLLTKINTD
jgi:hypothetical protein